MQQVIQKITVIRQDSHSLTVNYIYKDNRGMGNDFVMVFRFCSFKHYVILYNQQNL